MNNFQWKHIALVAIAVVAILAIWLGRFDIVTVDKYAYKLDRWSGNVKLLYGSTSKDVQPQE